MKKFILSLISPERTHIISQLSSRNTNDVAHCFKNRLYLPEGSNIEITDIRSNLNNKLRNRFYDNIKS